MTKIESAKKRIHISGSIVQPIAKERSVVYESKALLRRVPQEEAAEELLGRMDKRRGDRL